MSILPAKDKTDKEIQTIKDKYERSTQTESKISQIQIQKDIGKVMEALDNSQKEVH